jgi:hypothetical protein
MNITGLQKTKLPGGSLSAGFFELYGMPLNPVLGWRELNCHFIWQGLFESHYQRWWFTWIELGFFQRTPEQI